MQIPICSHSLNLQDEHEEFQDHEEELDIAEEFADIVDVSVVGRASSCFATLLHS
jgi:hypothetical protein